MDLDEPEDLPPDERLPDDLDDEPDERPPELLERFDERLPDDLAIFSFPPA